MISAAKEVGPPGSSASDPRRALVDRIIVSSTFAKCERLSSLLNYVCDLSLNGRVKEINEQKIGEAVFGRPRNYDSSIDGIVRTQASRLRQRLELYFSEEGLDEPIWIVIPRGGYVPVFEPRLTPVVPLLTPTVVPEQPAAKLEVRRALWGLRSAAIAWSLVAILLVAMVTILLANRGASIKGQVARTPVHPLWSQIFVAEQRTLEVPGDSGLVMWQGLVGKSVSLSEYLTGDYRTNLLPRSLTTLQDAAVDMGGRRYTSIVDLEAAKSLSLMAQSAQGKLEVRYARDVRPNDLKQGNVILVGAAEANPWVELFEHNMNFVFFNDRVRKTFSVLNREPRGEPRQWDSHYTDVQHRVYAVVAFLPNLGGNGNALILEGTSMAGTESAWDFVSDDSQLLPFLKRIQRANGTVPHFELVLGTNNMSGSAVKNTVLAWRTTN